MKKGIEITVRREPAGEGYQASLTNQPGLWERGDTFVGALGKLVIALNADRQYDLQIHDETLT